MRRMMRMLTLGVMALGMAGGLTVQASAQLNVRQLNQERRIDAGERSGKLTRGEAARLDREQRAIKQRRAQLKARHGGHLTRRDKGEIKLMQERANVHILNQKHNGRRGRNHLKL